MHVTLLNVVWYRYYLTAGFDHHRQNSARKGKNLSWVCSCLIGSRPFIDRVTTFVWSGHSLFTVNKELATPPVPLKSRSNYNQLQGKNLTAPFQGDSSSCFKPIITQVKNITHSLDLDLKTRTRLPRRWVEPVATVQDARIRVNLCSDTRESRNRTITMQAVEADHTRPRGEADISTSWFC